MSVGHLLCDQGVSGDLLLGALIDVGVPLRTVQEAVAELAIPDVSIKAERTSSPAAATRVTVHVPEVPRLPTLREAQQLLDGAALPGTVAEHASATMRALAEAEARVHDSTPDEVQFHELGSLDTVVDVVGVCAGLNWLGVERLTHGTINVGAGSVASDHGPLSVPPPAVTELLRGRTIEGRGSRELTTPTGAALLAVLTSPSPGLAPMHLHSTGRGIVTPSRSILTLLLGAPVQAMARSPAVVLEATMDDLEPQLVPVILDRLRALGAMDVWTTDIRMKKGRGGLTITVLCSPERLDELRGALIRETPTIGARWYDVQRLELERDHVTTDVGGNSVRIKRGWLDGTVVNAHPEFEDVLALALSSGRPVRDIYLAALREASLMIEDRPPTGHGGEPTITLGG